VPRGGALLTKSARVTRLASLVAGLREGTEENLPRRQPDSADPAEVLQATAACQERRFGETGRILLGGWPRLP
jgi:hypothetical protein